MFEHNSRYANLDKEIYEDVDGRRIAYVKRRFLPPGRSHQVLVEARVEVGDRLDLIAARTLGDPEQFWQICDANDAMNPFALTRKDGGSLRIPVPRFQDGL